jgi:chorismate lyase/3-hydroxybenzoate synthase
LASLDTDSLLIPGAGPDAASGAIDGTPSWVMRFVGRGTETRQKSSDGLLLSVVDNDGKSICSVRVPDAVNLDSDGFRRATLLGYRAIMQALKERSDQRPVRMWNFIPGILDPLGGLPHRYMAFNAGRFEAFREWQPGREGMSTWVPTSSGVGNTSSDLVIHALASVWPGVPVENRRQVSSYRYSARYGPRPPCFSRAVRLERDVRESNLLMLGGTASVVGEDTLHANDILPQIDETLRNLEVLIRDGLPECFEGPAPEDALGHVRQLRVFYVRQEDLPPIERAVNARFSGLQQLEYARTDLCRDGLVVELEGVAGSRDFDEVGTSQGRPLPPTKI